MTVKAIRLIVEDGGKKRTFKVTPGKLSIGSGVNAQLKLSGESIAEDHAELEILEESAILHVRPGARFPKIDGRAVKGDVPLDGDVTVSIGASKLTLEFEREAPPPAAVEPPKASATRERAVPEHKTKAEIGSRRVLWVNVGVAVIVGAILLYKLTASEAPPTPEEVANKTLQHARELVKVAKWSEVETELSHITPEFAARTDFKSQIENIRKSIDDAHKQARADADLYAGNDWLKVKLKDFDNNYLQGKIDEPAARLFVKRCRFFRQRWPAHPEMDWVTRNEARFDGVIDLSKPPTWADVEFEVKVLSYRIQLPDYREVFKLFDEFRPHASADEAKRLDQLVAEKKNDRAVWFAERLDKARAEFESKQARESFSMLVSIVIYAGDADMAAQAAARMMKFDDFDARMRAYRQDVPDEWAELLSEPSLASWANSQGLK